MDFQERVVIVTGSSRGIGKCTAELFATLGATVIGTYANKVPEGCTNTEYYHLDVSDRKECESFVNLVLEKYGHIDVLVNNAGITSDSLTKKMTNDQFDEVIGTNLVGTWNVTKLIGPIMQFQKSGSIINISSIVGEYGNMGQCNYAASKAGIIALTKTWAREFAFRGAGVRVNAVAPGYTMTDMLKTVPEDLLKTFEGQTMLGRLAEPIEIANAVVFLASDMASYITGTVLDVNGGMRL